VNYFAHSYHHLDAPYFVAGTAVPDLLSVCEPRRLRRERVLVVRGQNGSSPDADDAEAQIVAGILRHFEDDALFHASDTFSRVSAELKLSIRERYPGRPRLRASFLGHVLTELLLDACLIEADPGRLGTYYAALESTNVRRVQRAVNRLLPAPTERLAPCLERFLKHRFLGDYLDDERLLFRLGQVLRRVGLPVLPDDFRSLLPAWRERVRSAVGELLRFQ
jgi:hypothetical protein